MIDILMGLFHAITTATVYMMGQGLVAGGRDKTFCGNSVRLAGTKVQKRGGRAWNRAQQQGPRNEQYLGHCEAIQLWRGVKGVENGV